MAIRPLPLGAILLMMSCLHVRPATNEVIERTPERLERGRYLAEAVADCGTCHGPRDWSKYAGPVQVGLSAAGGDELDSRFGYPGVVVAPNLTTLANASDGELVRAIREGISHDGRNLFPSMPYAVYRDLSDEDVRSLVVWIRSLAPVERVVATTRVNFPVSVFIRGVPRPVEGPVRPPNRDDAVASGRWLVSIAGCRECHSPVARGQVIEERAFTGTRVFKTPTFTCTSANLTSVSGTWLAVATRSDFISRFKAFEHQAPPSVEAGQNTVMNWYAFSGMTESDLGSIYAYLKTLSPQP